MSQVQGYSGPYGNMFGYISGAGARVGMPAGSNNQNAFIAGLTSQYLNGTTSTLHRRRGVAAYSNRSSTASFPTRLTVPGTIAWPARFGPVHAFFPNRVGKPANQKTSPY